MDRLLEKLRQNMAELSVQGDDFTRQIWHMYATFEEFIDTHTIFGKAEVAQVRAAHEPPVSRHVPVSRPRRRAATRHRARVIGGSACDLAQPRTDMAASTPISSSAPAAVASRFSYPATAAQLATSKDDFSVGYRKAQHRCRYRRRRRTDIANPLLETISAIHDACESDDHEYEAGTMRREHRLSGSRFCSDADRDSIGYAGSNSIDSGYKSSCPTPEPFEGMFYANEAGSKRSSIASQGSQQSQRPRIPMGTKVMNRHSHPRYAGRDLDHLMYLRQSILSAMQRYEQQAVVSCPSPGFRPRSSSASSPSASPGPSSGPGSSPLPQRRAHMASYPGSRTHSPCYSSASGSGMSSPGYHRSRLATAEEDIDSLLYGRIDDLPCSYVTMIEDKYRRSSVARVKKLREKNREGPMAVESSSSSDSSCPSPTQSPPSGRFSEVAKCMLEIIEDLQNQSQVPGVAVEHEPSVSPPAPAPNPPTPASSAGNDYHVYEEIMYELTARPRADPGPPPLPARPDVIFRGSKSGHGIPLSLRPKQRSNLYSLFQEPSIRRDISQSLEQEYRGAQSGLENEEEGRPRARTPAGAHGADEEYGFRMPT